MTFSPDFYSFPILLLPFSHSHTFACKFSCQHAHMHIDTYTQGPLTLCKSNLFVALCRWPLNKYRLMNSLHDMSDTQACAYTRTHTHTRRDLHDKGPRVVLHYSMDRHYNGAGFAITPLPSLLPIHFLPHYFTMNHLYALVKWFFFHAFSTPFLKRFPAV